ncbi:pyruvate dehydrogenase [acetyl-transferring]-phosphatase 1, mitochondrial [Diorhabda carinulata]|uniref:pyruvate dehydrogenase [acetyl-transferring]-phosphatase 1, mitochondrial n=1 Tax=Diorhabda carinulata TaxID=1163345 RepID=UPI00259FFA0E|nr:pyruvate dehydrogenase [acetyl-transferring]-phosphatase 1, mitochondrial [Diorhabda carinulata]
MVVSCRTSRLLRTTKTVTVTPSLFFSSFKPFYQNSSNFLKRNALGISSNQHKPLVDVCCGCRYFAVDYFQSNDNRTTFSKLTPQEVDDILRTNEYTQEFSKGSVKSYDSNQLASNNPIEDTRSEASCLLTTGFLFGVFDGHGGSACAQVVAKRLYHYIAACLLPYEILVQYIKSLLTSHPKELIHCFNDKVEFVDDIRQLYSDSFARFLKDLSQEGPVKNFDMRNAIEHAFSRLDNDISNEALPKKDEPLNLKTMSVAMSGAVVCVAHIDGPHLHVANVGDCCAVLGTLSETNSWIANKLTVEHNTYNQQEVDRIIKEHPYNEALSVIRMDRLLGQLAPLRAMGDFRFKWNKEIMNNVIAKHFGEQVLLPNYHTPPYLSSSPDVVHHRLTARDKFLIIATDGLWDMMTPLQAVRLVGEHMKGKVTLRPLKLPRKNMTLNEINEVLLQRKEGLKTKPRDSNAATHIIRNALGGTEFGIDHSKITQLLTLPEDVVRVFRDDITISIIYFDSEYLRHCPA